MILDDLSSNSGRSFGRYASGNTQLGLSPASGDISHGFRVDLRLRSFALEPKTISKFFPDHQDGGFNLNVWYTFSCLSGTFSHVLFWYFGSECGMLYQGQQSV